MKAGKLHDWENEVNSKVLISHLKELDGPVLAAWDFPHNNNKQ